MSSLLLGAQRVDEKASHCPGPMVLQQRLERRLMGPPGREMVGKLLRDLFRAITTINKPERDAHIFDGDVNGADISGDRERGDPHGGTRQSLITARQKVFSATHRQIAVRAAWPNGIGRLGTTYASVATPNTSTHTEGRSVDTSTPTTPRRFPRMAGSVRNGCRPPCVPKWRTETSPNVLGRRRRSSSSVRCRASDRVRGR